MSTVMILTDGLGAAGMEASKLGHEAAVDAIKFAVLERFKNVDEEAFEVFFIALFFDLMASSFPFVGKDGALFVVDEVRHLIDLHFDEAMGIKSDCAPGVQ